ncbi:MAG: hypothetical protein GY928_08580 [Colwellia sp.]|nr:hypothetical protein [Colwellia sp.]
MNTNHNSAIGQTPYNALFGSAPRFGLSDICLPKQILDKITTEEELEQIFGYEMPYDDNNSDKSTF